MAIGGPKARVTLSMTGTLFHQPASLGSTGFLGVRVHRLHPALWDYSRCHVSRDCCCHWTSRTSDAWTDAGNQAKPQAPTFMSRIAQKCPRDGKAAEDAVELPTSPALGSPLMKERTIERKTDELKQCAQQICRCQIARVV